MPDLDALKSRVERAQRHLDAAREVRERQSAALVEMWRQIRDRFVAQEREIEDYRGKLSTLEDEHAELTRQVEALLEVIDRGLGRADDETVPRIAGMAQALLDGEDSSDVIEIPEAPDHEAIEPPRERARREVRELVGRVEDSHLAPPPASDPDDDPHRQERDDIADLRAELKELGVRLGARQG
jgi:uncharacterized protein involved in exopolysaccharide biosynthesis